MQWDLIVIGAGAAGILAAARAAETGKRTLLLERNRKPGVKILMSGGTRCNITHDTDSRGIVAAYGRQGKFLHSPLAALGPRELIQLIEAEGVATKVEPGGKIFPVNNKAIEVRDALLKRMNRCGATMATGEAVKGIRHSESGFEVATEAQTFESTSVLLTTGGQSYPGCGTRGDGYAWAKEFGHSITQLKPALTPITLKVPWILALSGITLPDVGLKVRDPNVGKPLEEDRGSFLFTHFGLSGPVVLNVSRAISGHAKKSSLWLECDFVPNERMEELDEFLKTESAADGKRALAGVLSKFWPKRFAESLLESVGQPADRRIAELRKEDRRKLVQAMKATILPVTGTLGFEKAEVTAGGVELKEVDFRTMQSRIIPNLYFAGEILDLDGPIGGYNFQAAFSTGWLAGEKAPLTTR